MNSSVFYDWVLTGQNLYKTCTYNHGCCKFKSEASWSAWKSARHTYSPQVREGGFILLLPKFCGLLYICLHYLFHFGLILIGHMHQETTHSF